MKKFRKSPLAIACYVIAAAFAAYFCTIVVSTIVTIHQYYAAYQMSATFGEVAGYLFQNGLEPLFAAIVTFMAGIILEEVRKLNPANWATDEEIAAAKEAKKMAREAKQIAKGEAAKAAAETESDDAEDEKIKPEFAAAVAEPAAGTDAEAEVCESDETVIVEDTETAAEQVDAALAEELSKAIDDAATVTEETASEGAQFYAEVAGDTEA